MKVVALAGGVGGAKLADGLSRALASQDLTIIVNTADDFDHMGLHISPDLDTVCYTLAGTANRRTGWGRADETWNTMANLSQLGAPDWFRLGDKDIATHLERTRLLKRGDQLNEVVARFCQAWGIEPKILPMTNAAVATVVQTDAGPLEFQEYFVHRECQPRVLGFQFRGADSAAPSPGVVESLESADCVILCPSNPWVSIGPILAIPGIRELVASHRCVAVSPIIGGKAVRGPASKMYSEMGIEPSALAVADHYRDVVTAFVLDNTDAQLEARVQRLGMRTLTAQTVMRTIPDRRRLAREVLNFMQVD